MSEATAAAAAAAPEDTAAAASRPLRHAAAVANAHLVEQKRSYTRRKEKGKRKPTSAAMESTPPPDPASTTPMSPVIPWSRALAMQEEERRAREALQAVPKRRYHGRSRRARASKEARPDGKRARINLGATDQAAAVNRAAAAAALSDDDEEEENKEEDKEEEGKRDEDEEDDEEEDDDDDDDEDYDYDEDEDDEDEDEEPGKKAKAAAAAAQSVCIDSDEESEELPPGLAAAKTSRDAATQATSVVRDAATQPAAAAAAAASHDAATQATLVVRDSATQSAAAAATRSAATQFNLHVRRTSRATQATFAGADAIGADEGGEAAASLLRLRAELETTITERVLGVLHDELTDALTRTCDLHNAEQTPFARRLMSEVLTAAERAVGPLDKACLTQFPTFDDGDVPEVNPGGLRNYHGTDIAGRRRSALVFLDKHGPRILCVVHALPSDTLRNFGRRFRMCSEEKDEDGEVVALPPDFDEAARARVVAVLDNFPGAELRRKQAAFARGCYTGSGRPSDTPPHDGYRIGPVQYHLVEGILRENLQRHLPYYAQRAPRSPRRSALVECTMDLFVFVGVQFMRLMYGVDDAGVLQILAGQKDCMADDLV